MLCHPDKAKRCRRGALASVNLKFPSFAPRQKSSRLDSALDLASVATPMRNEHRFATATRYDSVACDERNFSSSEERALAPLGLSAPRSLACEIRGEASL